MRRAPPISSPGSTIAVSSVPTACRNVSVSSPDPAPPADDRCVRRDDRDQQAGDEDDPCRGAGGDRGRDDPGQREPLQQLAGLRVDPMPPLGERRISSTR